MKDTIFIDFDGVIRHWSDEEIKASEQLAGVDEGILFSVAFAPQYLSPAIEGAITHEEWIRNVEAELTKRYNEEISLELIRGWCNASWKIDWDLVKKIRFTAPRCKLVLVTNATTRLSSDLKTAGLELDIVVNSADIGSAKPAATFYQSALSMANTTAKKSIFIDDSWSHVEAAISLGIDSIQHEDVTKTIAFVRQRCT